MARLAIVSDVHMRPAHAESIETELSRAVDHIAAFEPDRVVCLGDIIEHEDAATDRAMVERVHRTLTDAPAPVTYLLGNHDVEHLSRAELGDLLGQERFHGTFDIDGQSFLLLDTSWASVSGARGVLGAPQLRWLAATLPELAETVVLSHHPVGTFDLRENHWFADYPERAFFGDRREFCRLASDHGDVWATISGHIHETAAVQFRDAHHCSVNAFSKERRDKPLTGTYALVTIEDTVEIEICEGETARERFVFEPARLS